MLYQGFNIHYKVVVQPTLHSIFTGVTVGRKLMAQSYDTWLFLVSFSLKRYLLRTLIYE